MIYFIRIYIFTILVYLGTAAQSNSQIPFYTAEQLSIDIDIFQPNRAIYQNIIYREGIPETNGYVFIDLDKTQMWTEKNLMIHWGRESIGATGFDIVFTDKNLGIRSRQMPSMGYPGGVILENHYYGHRTDVIFTNPNNEAGLDTLEFSYPKKDETYKYNEVYSYSKKYKYSHNVLVWPYVMATIDWSLYEDLIMPGFSPLGIQEYYYRMIRGDDVEILDEKGKNYKGFIVTGIRNENISVLQKVKFTDTVPRTDYFISTEAPYYLGKVVYSIDSEGTKVLTYRESFLGYELLNYSYQKYLGEMLKLSKDFLKDFDMPWIINKQKVE